LPRAGAERWSREVLLARLSSGGLVVMLTQLVTVKKRLGIALTDATFDEALTRAIQAVSARFDRECNRTLARSVNITQEFCADEIEIPAICYPIESVAGFELRSTVKAGWVAQGAVDYNVRCNCVISLAVPLVPHPPASVPSLARVTYTGGFVLPGTVVEDGQMALPTDLEWAVVEEVAGWYQQRDKVGLIREWPSGGTYLSLSQLPLLPEVTAIIRRYQRWVV
jgi:hypothetical protein